MQKLTLLDYPDEVACIVFTRGCNFACPFCHNSELIGGGACMDESEVLSYLKKRRGILDGVVITDDLYMDAITEYAGLEAAAVLAVQAGNDLNCCTDYVQQIPAVIQAVNQGEISLERVEQSVLRTLCWKLELGVIV